MLQATLRFLDLLVKAPPHLKLVARAKKNILCSPEGVNNSADKTKSRRSRSRSKKEVEDVDDADDWSVGADVRSGSLFRSPLEDDGNESYVKSEVILAGPYHNRQYHREDLSFYGTDAGTSYYDERSIDQSHYSCVNDDRSYYEDVDNDRSFQRRRVYRDSPFIRR